MGARITVSIVLVKRLGVPGKVVPLTAGTEIFLFSETSRPALWPTQPPIQWTFW